MADSKTTALTELATVADADVLYIVDDPGGTPISKKITKANLVTDIAYNDIKAADRTGSDVKLVTGTEGTNGNLVQWNADGDAVDSSIAASDVLVDSDIGTNVQAHSSVLDNTTASFTTADETKLDGIETGADVTDETNVTDALDGATLSAATVATDDKVLIQDTNDSNVLKTVTAQSIADLASGGAPRFSMSDMFTNSGRYVASGSGGSVSFGNSGLFMSFTTSLVEHGRLLRVNGATSSGVFFDNNPIFNAIVEVQAQPSGAGEVYFGLGEISSSTSGHTFTNKHIGFKIVWSGGTATLSGTVADGTTEATATLTGVTITNQNYYSAVCDSGGGSVEFFVNGVSKGTVSTNYPSSSGANDILKFSQNSKSDSGSTIHCNYGGWEYSREA